MKIITLWVWAFWLAILQHISSNNPHIEFFAYEKDEYALSYMKENRKNPYFFTNTILNKNITFVDDITSIVPTADLIILAIPNQYIQSSIIEIKPLLKSWVCFLNLSKWIDNVSLRTVSDTIAYELSNFDYHYAVLSGGMIAQELIDWNELWVQIGISNLEIGQSIRSIFENKNLHIDISGEYKNIELYGALKNIIALYVWYLEWQWYGYSTIWYHFCNLLKELPYLLEILGWTSHTDFSQYALWWDLIATCFGQSRNRYFWNLVGLGKSPEEALQILRWEKKHAEWYETLKWLQSIITEEGRLINYKKILNIFFP